MTSCRHSRLLLWSLLLLGALVAAPLSIRAQPRTALKRSNLVQLARLTPSGWFSMLVPAGSSSPESKADIDGRSIDSELIKIDYSYYAYVNTPHFLIDSATRRPYRWTRQPKAGAKATWIGGRRAWIRVLDGSTRSLHWYLYGYHIELFGLPVPFGDGTTRRGTIRFEISTHDRRYLPDVWRIIRSIDFTPKTQPN